MAGIDSRRIYDGRCHCGRLRFRVRSVPFTAGCRCNCSMCIRRGIVMSPSYYGPEDVVELEGLEALHIYQFGDRDVVHYFCGTCGISPFTTVASVPADYAGPAKPGDYRINLGCIDALDVLSLEIQLIDGSSF